MAHIFELVNQLFAQVVPVADFLWDFPTNIDAYANIPILGQLSIAFLLLLGGSLYFTLRFGFVQVKEFKTGIRLLTSKQQAKVGTSQLAAFLVSMGGRVGAGNIVGVTGAVTFGGPGAIFWMWVSAFLGMATSFCEATLAQIFKERKGNEYVGGFTFYIQKIWKNKAWIGAAMCIMYLIYNMLSIPVHTFHVFTAVSSIADEVTGKTTQVTDPLYYVIAVAIIVVIAVITFGGIKSVTKFSDAVVPVMAGLYVLIVLVLIVLNIGKVPGFFAAVFVGAFKPSAIFGGAFGVAMAQGLKRGLLSNEAGMGTATQASSIADANHPCEQGFIQSIGVFVDTIVICSLAGFVVTAGAIWNNPSIDWDVMKANKISKNKKFIYFTRCLGALIFVPLGTLTVLSGLQLDNLWYVSDLINVILIFVNIPTLLVGRKLVTKAYENYKKNPGRRFVASDIGVESEVWTAEAAKENR